MPMMYHSIIEVTDVKLDGYDKSNIWGSIAKEFWVW